MGFRIQNNIAAMNAQSNLGVSDANLSKSLQRLSSGYRINSAKDDAAGLAISQSFRADIASVKVAQRNITEANSLLQVAEGAMSSVGDILTRMKELATQSASANVGDDRAKVSAEYDTLVAEIDRIANSTKYAGVSLTDGTFTSGGALDANNSTWDTAVANTYDIDVADAAAGAYVVTASATANTITMTKGTESQTLTTGDGARTYDFTTFGISFKQTASGVGDTVGAAMAGTQTVTVAATSKNFQVGYEKTGQSQMAVGIDSITSSTLGLAAADIDSATDAYNALETIDTAISDLATSRAEIGAYQNRLTYASANLTTTLENFSAAESAIRDVDMAAEMTSFTKNQILVQAGTAMLAQANSAPQQVLSLLQG